MTWHLCLIWFHLSMQVCFPLLWTSWIRKRNLFHHQPDRYETNISNLILSPEWQISLHVKGQHFPLSIVSGNVTLQVIFSSNYGDSGFFLISAGRVFWREATNYHYNVWGVWRWPGLYSFLVWLHYIYVIILSFLICSCRSEFYGTY